MKQLNTVLVLLSALSCSPQLKDDIEVTKQEIIKTDKAFSALCEQKGMKKAFVLYASDDVIKPRDNKQPLIGKNALIKSFEGAPPQAFTLTWEPLKADVSEGLGYTFGNWQMKSKTSNGTDTTYYGNYVSIWKRQSDGAWKYVFDSGNPTPAPSVLQ